MKRVLFFVFFLAIIGCTNPSQNWVRPSTTEEEARREWVKCKNREFLTAGPSERRFQGVPREDCMKEKGFRLKEN